MIDRSEAYPKIWQKGRDRCSQNYAFDPVSENFGQRLPLDTLKNWLDKGLAQKIQLNSYGTEHYLSFEVLCFDTEKNESWRIKDSDYLKANSHDAAILEITELGMKQYYDKRFAEYYLNW